MMLSPQWEAFARAARGCTTDRPPVALIVDSPWIPGFVGMRTLDFFLSPQAWLAAQLQVLARFPEVLFVPGFWVEYGMANEPSAFGARVAWRDTSPPDLRPLPLYVAEWTRLPRPDPETDGLMPLVLRRLEQLEAGGLPEPHRIHMVAARGPLTVAAHVVGMLPFLEATAAEPDAVHGLLAIVTDTVIAFLRAQLARLREPLGVLLLDDLPGLLSPRAFDAIALPYLQRVLDAFEGLVRVYHNDTPCPHLLSRIGALHCEAWNFSHEMDLATVRREVGPRLALMGNVAPLELLVRGTPDAVFRAASDCVAEAGGGPLILSAGGGLSPGTPAANIDALVRAARG